MVFEASCLLLSQHLLIAHIAADAFLRAYELVEAGGPTGVHRVDIERTHGGASTLAGTGGYGTAEPERCHDHGGLGGQRRR